MMSRMNTPRLIIVFAIVASLGFAAPALAEDTTPLPRKKGLVIGIDGCRHDAVVAAQRGSTGWPALGPTGVPEA